MYRTLCPPAGPRTRLAVNPTGLTLLGFIAAWVVWVLSIWVSFHNRPSALAFMGLMAMGAGSYGAIWWMPIACWPWKRIPVHTDS